MPAALKLTHDQRTLVETYADWRAEAGLAAGCEKLWGARAFGARVGAPVDWEGLPLDEQLALPARVRTFVGWLLLTGRARATADYLVAVAHGLGRSAVHHHLEFHDEFVQTAVKLGFCAEPQNASGGRSSTSPCCTACLRTRSPPRGSPWAASSSRPRSAGTATPMPAIRR